MDPLNDRTQTREPYAASEPAPVTTTGSHGPTRKLSRAAMVGASLLIGGGAMALAIAGPLSTDAASAGLAVNAQLANQAGSTTTGDSTTGCGFHGGPGDGHGRGGLLGPNHELVTDTSVVAGVLGMSEADVISGLQAGKSYADLAKAKSVDVQKVIDALVADQTSEIDAARKAGTITQAQADAEKTNLAQRITDQVNATGGFHGGLGEGHGRGGDGGTPSGGFSTTGPSA